MIHPLLFKFFSPSLIFVKNGSRQVSFGYESWVDLGFRPDRHDDLFCETLVDLTDEELQSIEEQKPLSFEYVGRSATWGSEVVARELKKSSVVFSITDMDEHRVRLLKRAAFFCKLPPCYSLFWVRYCLF